MKVLEVITVSGRQGALCVCVCGVVLESITLNGRQRALWGLL